MNDILGNAQKLIVELEKALATNPPKPEPLLIVKTKTLKMWYILLPIQDMSIPFMYSFEEPIRTVWRKARLGLNIVADPIEAITPREETLKKFGLEQWFKLVTKGMTGPLPSEAQWMMEVDSCELIQCEITPIKKP